MAQTAVTRSHGSFELRVNTLGIIAAAIFLLTMLASPTLGAGWFWDMGNAFGFCAFVGLLYLFYASARKLNLKAHRLLGNTVLLVVALHVFWLLLGDPVVVEYIRPDAPHYMWAGIMAFVLLNVLILFGLPEYRLRIHKDRDSFRHWHRWIAIGVVAGSAWHIVGAGQYLRMPYQWMPMLAIVAIACFASRFSRHNNDLSSRSSWLFLGITLIATSIFTLIRNI